MGIMNKEFTTSWRENIGKTPDKALEQKIISGRVYSTFYDMKSGDAVLNLGCGMGPQIATFKGRFSLMIGADIVLEKLAFAENAADYYGVSFRSCCTNVEELPFKSRAFDKIIAIDTIEHVYNPNRLLDEASRVLKDDGTMLITFPCMLDRWKALFEWFQRPWRQKLDSLVNTIKGFLRPTPAKPESKVSPADGEQFDPDPHRQEMSPRKWKKLFEQSGFHMVKSRGTTLFPPLHVLGVRKFWYTNDLIFRVDSFLSSLVFLKNLGQSKACVLRKK